jgi:hypothetical protein
VEQTTEAEQRGRERRRRAAPAKRQPAKKGSDPRGILHAVG